MEVKAIEAVQGEKREGFYIQPIIKRVWLVELEILKVIDRICRRHCIKYFAMWGTLLGAVRHRGFIPWDDDMDLGMLREDYERFQYYAQMELPEGWQILKQNPTLIRVINSDVIRVDQEFLNRNHGCPYIVGIDLFCIDVMPQNKTDKEVYVNLFWAVCNLHERWEFFKEDGEWAEKKWLQLQEIEDITGFQFDFHDSIKEQLYTLGDHMAAMYWDMDFEEVTIAPYLCSRPDYHMMRSCFDRIVEVPFENVMIPIMEDYDTVCRVSYGDDYMVPMRKYDYHDYPFFKDQIEKLRNYFAEQGMKLPDFFDIVIEQENRCKTVSQE